MEMVDAVGGDGRTTLGLGEDEGALENGLGVQCEAFGTPIGIHTIFPHGFADVGLKCPRMAGDIAGGPAANGCAHSGIIVGKATRNRPSHGARSDANPDTNAPMLEPASTSGRGASRIAATSRSTRGGTAPA